MVLHSPTRELPVQQHKPNTDEPSTQSQPRTTSTQTASSPSLKPQASSLTTASPRERCPSSPSCPSRPPCSRPQAPAPRLGSPGAAGPGRVAEAPAATASAPRTFPVRSTPRRAHGARTTRTARGTRGWRGSPGRSLSVTYGHPLPLRRRPATQGGARMQARVERREEDGASTHMVRIGERSREEIRRASSLGSGRGCSSPGRWATLAGRGMCPPRGLQGRGRAEKTRSSSRSGSGCSLGVRGNAMSTVHVHE